MIKEAIVLAGGFGERLKSVVKNKPKPMAEINNKPFLAYILEFLQNQNIDKVILSVGYKKEIIQNYFGNRYLNLMIEYAVEEEPLGTGGGIKNAIKLIQGEEFFLLNGDTFFNVDLNFFYKLHKNSASNLSIALKILEIAERYGAVVIDKTYKIIAFHEKAKRYNVFINGGTYILNKNFFCSFELENKFSFEKDFLEKLYKTCAFYGFPFEGFFIDIGIPEDYQRAQEEFKKISFT